MRAGRGKSACCFGSAAFGSCEPTMKWTPTRRVSTATTKTSAQERPASGCSKVLKRYGASPGRRGSRIGTHTPSPSADQALSAGPGSLGWNGGSSGAAPALGGGGGGGGTDAEAGTFQYARGFS